jgi:high-affinity nickel-transport protein
MTETDGLLSLCVFAFALGAKHGFDADHLATIDAISRHNAKRKPLLARATGALFSLGHGLVVIAVAYAAGLVKWETPRWLEASGGLIAMIVVLALALLNFRALRTTAPNEPVRLSGLRSRVLARAPGVGNPLGISLIGMLFAISFDTVSQAALFGIAASQSAVPGAALLVGASFVSGMIIVDAATSLWMTGLVLRADRRAAEATRVMAFTIAVLSLLVGLLIALKLLSPAVADWADQQALWLGVAVILFGLMGFVAAMMRAAPQEHPSRII